MQDVTRTELEFIAQDNAELIQLALSIGHSPSAGEIGLGLSPFIALFAEESFKYLTAPARRNSEYNLSSPLFETFSEAVTKLRARAKLFDDNRGGLEGLIQTLALIHRKSNEWFLHPHRGFLGWFKRRLQPDLGIYYFEEHVICTTHTALLTLGLTHDQILALGPADMRNVGIFAHEFSVAAGTYLGQLATYLREHSYSLEMSSSNVLTNLELPITHNDHYGHLVYAHTSDRLGLTRPELSTAIIFLISQINFVERILTHLLAPTSVFLLRARFMTAYHATTALQELERLDGDPDTYLLGQIAQSLLNNPDSDFLLGARQVRNIMAHYELRGAAQFLTPHGDPLNDVLIGLCQCRVAEVTATVQRQLSRISEAFVEVISKRALKDNRALLGNHT